MSDLYEKRSRWWLLAIIAWGCTSAPPPGVLRIDHKHPPKAVEGPIILNFGPFDTRWDALLAACPLILSMPGGNAGLQDAMGFDVRWRVSREYCSWLYYTPDQKYEMSMLVEGPEPRPYAQNKRSCELPMFVDDKRYPAGSLKYVYFIHNHPEFPTRLSEKDMLAIALINKFHGEPFETREGRMSVGFVAFFSKTYDPHPAGCDGFFEHMPGSDEVLLWESDNQGHWHKEVVGTVNWTHEGKAYFRFKKAQ